MQTYSFEVHVTGNVRIDADSAEAAQAEFIEQISQEAVLVTARQDQILVISGMAWEDPEVWVDPDEPADPEEIEEVEDVEDVEDTSAQEEEE